MKNDYEEELVKAVEGVLHTQSVLSNSKKVSPMAKVDSAEALKELEEAYNHYISNQTVAVIVVES